MPNLFSLVHVLAATALAQDGYDAHGFVQAGNDGELLDPLALYRAERNQEGRIAFGGLFEYAKEPLVLYHADDTEETLLDSLVTLNAAGHFSLSERVAFSASAPVHLSYSGARVDEDGAHPVALGDLRFALPVSLVLPEPDATGLSVALVPYADLPTGKPRYFLGNSGIAGGGLVAANYGNESWDVGGNLGFQASPGIDYENLRGGARLLAGLSGGYALTETLAVRGEGIIRPNFSRNEEPRSDSPGELLLSARGAYDSGFDWTIGGAAGVTGGASAAAFRLFLGAGWKFGQPPVLDTDGDGIVDPNDSCPTEAETVNQYSDTDGCPDHLADLAVLVVDTAGNPLPGAKIVVEGKEYTADAQGRVTVKDLMPGGKPKVEATADAFQPGKAEASLNEGANELKVALQPMPAKVTVAVKDVSGKPLDARVGTKIRKGADDMKSIGEDGVEVVELEPGERTVIVAADGYTTERRTVTLKPAELLTLDITLMPTKAVVKEKEIAILEQVQFDFNSDTIKAESFPLLDSVAASLLDNPQVTRIEVQGHTDDKGNDKYNLELSQKRVESVVKYLVAKGVDASRLVPKGYGETVPLKPNTNEKNRALNRRVQFVILEQGAGDTTVMPAAAPAPEGGK